MHKPPVDQLRHDQGDHDHDARDQDVLPEIAHGREFSEGKRLPAHKAFVEPVPKSDPILAEMPAKQHQIAAFGVAGGEVDEPAVEVLHLHAGSLEVGDQQPDLLRDLVDGILRLLDA